MGINECDDGNSISGDGCDNNCNFELGWSCGIGSYAKFDYCREICGDGRSLKTITEHGNMCDDANNWAGDGCDQDCVVEYGYTCSGGDTYEPDVCDETCGEWF